MVRTMIVSRRKNETYRLENLRMNMRISVLGDGVGVGVCVNKQKSLRFFQATDAHATVSG